MNNPKISVVLPVYNGEIYIYEAIDSILKQTYEDFELIIINDGSTDDSKEIILGINDSRIVYYEQTNQGLATTLNNAIKISRGKYIARQDQDDYSHPKRFQKQVALLDIHPTLGLLGTWGQIWEGASPTKRAHQHPTENLILKYHLLFNNPFVHSSVMIRKEVFDKVGLYSTDITRQPPEDYELWIRIAKEYDVANIPKVLHNYRDTPNRMSTFVNGRNPFLEKLNKLSKENLCNVLGKPISCEHVSDLVSLLHGDYLIASKPDLSELSNILVVASDRLCELHDVSSDLLNDCVSYFQINLRQSYLNFLYGSLIGRVVGKLDRYWRLFR